MITVEVHEFSMGDVEDPDLWAEQKIANWQRTDIGKWIMTNAVEPSSHKNFYEYGWQYTITAKMTEAQYTYYKLKYE